MSKLLDDLEGNDSPYYGGVTLAANPGDSVVSCTQDHPPLQVVDSRTMNVLETKIQVVKVVHPGTGEEAYVRRVVAVLDDGIEMDISPPESIAADISETGIDTTQCAACLLPLDSNDLRILDGKAYHNFCIQAEEDNG